MSIASIIVALADAYSFVLFVYVLMSWIPHASGVVGDVYRAFGIICEPYLKIFRRFIPPIGGTLDLSPIIAFFVLQLGVRLLVSIF